MLPCTVVSVVVLAVPGQDAVEAPEQTDVASDERIELSIDVEWEVGALALTTGTFLLQDWIGEREDGSPFWDSASRFDRWVRRRLGPDNESDRDSALNLSDQLLWGAIPLSILAIEAYDVAFDEGSYRTALLDAYTVAVAGFLAVQMSQVLKRGIQRSRPRVFPVGDEEVGAGFIHSFPSGHTMNAAAFSAAFVTQRYLMNDPNWPWYAALGGGLSVATGVARIGGDTHWATDTIAGFALGTAVGVAYPLLTRVPRGSDGGDTMFVIGPGSAEFVVRF